MKTALIFIARRMCVLACNVISVLRNIYLQLLIASFAEQKIYKQRGFRGKKKSRSILRTHESGFGRPRRAKRADEVFH